MLKDTSFIVPAFYLIKIDAIRKHLIIRHGVQCFLMN